MARRRSTKRTRTRYEEPIFWLPFDSRLILPIFSFGKVRGVARIFLEIEIVISTLIILLTLVLLVTQWLF
jgi:hypothetical protein